MAFAITPTTNAIRVSAPSNNNNKNKTPNLVGLVTVTDRSRRSALSIVCAVERSSASSSSDGKNKKGGGVPNSNYVVPLETSFPLSNSLARPLAEILRDLNKRIPDNIVKPHDRDPTLIPWYHANRMLSFYAPGWCGEIRDVIFSDNGSVTVVYRVTVRGSDGELTKLKNMVEDVKKKELQASHIGFVGVFKEGIVFKVSRLDAIASYVRQSASLKAHRESTGTVSPSDGPIGDAVAAAEEIAFCKACARFGLGLYLYHEDQVASI